MAWPWLGLAGPGWAWLGLAGPGWPVTPGLQDPGDGVRARDLPAGPRAGGPGGRGRAGDQPEAGPGAGPGWSWTSPGGAVRPAGPLTSHSLTLTHIKEIREIVLVWTEGIKKYFVMRTNDAIIEYSQKKTHLVYQVYLAGNKFRK